MINTKVMTNIRSTINIRDYNSHKDYSSIIELLARQSGQRLIY